VCRKWLNSENEFCGANVSPTPPGWDNFYAICDDRAYSNQTWNVNGQEVLLEEYTTSVVGNESVAWIRAQVQAGLPFVAHLTPHAPHIADNVYPYITQAAPWYVNATSYRGTTLPMRAPRTPNYNLSAPHHHPLIAIQQAIGTYTEDWTDLLFRERFRSMWSVDDMVQALMDTLVELGVADNTYWIFSSDHGYNLGQFREPSSKLNNYDHNLRVPFVIAGPGLLRNVTISDAVVSNVDIAATIIDLLGGDLEAADFDGRSFRHLIVDPALREQLHAPIDAPAWRDAVLIEYWSLNTTMRGPPTSPECNPTEGECLPSCDCRLHYVDILNNTYIGLRVVNATHNLGYFEFFQEPKGEFPVSEVYFRELFDLNVDPFEIHNLAFEPNATTQALIDKLSEQLHDQYGCKGRQCN
jgi:N-acetylglucosamine-6-sulfatase